MLEEEDSEPSQRDCHPGGIGISNGHGSSILSDDGGGRADNTTTTTSTVKIHTTYKKRANKFMNRPNVQNGLGTSSFLNPYAVSGTGGTRLVNSLQATSSFHQKHNHRSVISRSSLFGGGVGAGRAAPSQSTFNSTPSPQGTTASTTTASTTVELRPPFVTTVTRGRFLPSKFDLMVEKSLFTFSSRPKPVGLITRHQCSLSGGPLSENNSQNPPPRGAHDYFNVMWDPHIYRGTTTTFTSSLKQPDSENRKDEERYRKRRGLASNPPSVNNNIYNNNNRSPTGMGNRQRYRMTTKVSSRSRTFPPPQLISEGRHQVQVQTEEYLEDFTKDISRPEVDAIVQTDPVTDEHHNGSEGGIKRRLILSDKLGIDVSTQVLPGELASFDEQVQPIVESLVGKILEQALMETLAEEEIWALKAQQNRFLEKRKEEERELCRLREQQERISAEKERLKRHLQVQLLQQQNGDAETLLKLINMNNGGQAGNADENPMTLSTSCLLDLLPSVFNSLRQEGVLTDHAENDISQSLTEVLEKEIENRDESWDDNIMETENMIADHDENYSEAKDIDPEENMDNESELDFNEADADADELNEDEEGTENLEADHCTEDACMEQVDDGTTLDDDDDDDGDSENKEKVMQDESPVDSPKPEEDKGEDEESQQQIASESPSTLSKLPNGAISSVDVDISQNVADD